MTTLHEAAFPRIVSQAEWKASHDALRAREKAATKARDALAAERRRLPMTQISRTRAAPAGPCSSRHDEY
jgi:predicted dithiol-disulfide oxidoreductase (DUF899 family)